MLLTETTKLLHENSSSEEIVFSNDECDVYCINAKSFVLKQLKFQVDITKFNSSKVFVIFNKKESNVDYLVTVKNNVVNVFTKYNKPASDVETILNKFDLDASLFKSF